MLYFRYRKGDEFSIKELIYNELYFASPEESNDSEEGKTFIKFKSEELKWRKVFYNNDIFPELCENKDLLDKIVKLFSSKSEWTLAEILSLKEDAFSFLGNYSGLFVYLLRQYFTNSCNHLAKYFVSFSKKFNDSYMWKNYAHDYQGYCLIFDFKNNHVHQDPKNLKTQLRIKEFICLSYNVYAQIPEYFELNDITYYSKIKVFDGFLGFDKEKYQKYREEITAAYQQKKAEKWKYEVESRILLEMDRGVCGESEFSPFQRLFHYDFNQLVGIVFGQKMPQEKREQIKEIICEKIKSNRREDFVRDFFYILEETTSEDKLNPEIKPIEMFLPSTKLITLKDKNFDQYWQRFQQILANNQVNN